MATHRRGTSGAQWLVADLLRREGRAWPSLSPAARGLAVGGALLCSTVVAVSMAARAPDPRAAATVRTRAPGRGRPAARHRARLAHLAGGAAHPLARDGATRRGAPATARTAHGAPVAVAHGAGPDRRAERAGRRRRPRVDGAPARDGPARCGRCIVRRLDGPRDGQRQAPGRSPRGSRPGRRGTTGRGSDDRDWSGSRNGRHTDRDRATSDRSDDDHSDGDGDHADSDRDDRDHDGGDTRTATATTGPRGPGPRATGDHGRRRDHERRRATTTTTATTATTTATTATTTATTATTHDHGDHDSDHADHDSDHGDTTATTATTTATREGGTAPRTPPPDRPAEHVAPRPCRRRFRPIGRAAR